MTVISNEFTCFFFYLSVRFFSLFLRSWTISCAASSSFCLFWSCFWRSAFISFCCWFLSVPLTFGLSCLRCVGFTLSACSVSLELSAENSVKKLNKIDNIEFSIYFSKMSSVLDMCSVLTDRVVVYLFIFQLWIISKSRLNRKAKGTRLLKYSQKMIFCKAPKWFFSRKKSVSLRAISLSLSTGCCFPL